MKKIILLVVVLLLAVVPIVMLTMKDQIAGWFTPDAENAEEEEEAAPFFALEELTIKLTENFKESKIESDDSYLVLRGDGYSVEIERVDHSSITPNEGYPFPSLTEAMEFYLLSLGELDFAKEGEILCADGDDDGDGTPDTFVALFESDGAYWDIRISATKEDTDYETVREQGLKWAKTVTFDAVIVD